VAPLVKLICGKRLIISYQFDWANGMKLDYKGIKPRVSSLVQSMVIRSADHLLCTTEWLKEIAINRYNFRSERITIIPNYVNTDLFKPSSQKRNQIVFAGRLHWSKGIDTLIEAFKLFAQSHLDYKLIIIGSGEDESALHHQGSHPRIIFTGSISNDEVANYLAESRIFVLPTVNMEGHPKALIEAMSSGCICVTSDVPGNNHVLRESNSAEFLFRSGDVAHLAEKLLLAASSKKTAQYEYAIENYAYTKCFGKERDILKAYIK
jgi:glycosyltransferase involved in cell wall biosynthesis